jgi:hypothetical protein
VVTRLFCALAGLALVLAGVLGSHTLLHVATGLVLLLGVPATLGARAACVAVGLAFLIVGETWIGAVCLVVALVPAPRPERPVPSDLGGVADRTDLAYDASSPAQVFVGTRH